MPPLFIRVAPSPSPSAPPPAPVQATRNVPASDWPLWRVSERVDAALKASLAKQDSQAPASSPWDEFARQGRAILKQVNAHDDVNPRAAFSVTNELMQAYLSDRRNDVPKEMHARWQGGEDFEALAEAYAPGMAEELMVNLGLRGLGDEARSALAKQFGGVVDGLSASQLERFLKARAGDLAYMDKLVPRGAVESRRASPAALDAQRDAYRAGTPMGRVQLDIESGTIKSPEQLDERMQSEGFSVEMRRQLIEFAWKHWKMPPPCDARNSAQHLAQFRKRVESPGLPDDLFARKLPQWLAECRIDRAQFGHYVAEINELRMKQVQAILDIAAEQPAEALKADKLVRELIAHWQAQGTLPARYEGKLLDAVTEAVNAAVRKLESGTATGAESERP